MKKTLYLTFIFFSLFQSINSQNFEKNIKKISGKICECANEKKNKLNNELLSNCFKSAYSKNNSVMKNLLKHIDQNNQKLSEAEKRNLIAESINTELLESCENIRNYYSEIYNKRNKRKNTPKFIEIMSSEICEDLNTKFKSIKNMSNKTVDPIFNVYYKKYYSAIMKKYGNGKMEELGKDLVGDLMKKCTLYKDWTISLNFKK
jgi:uncharacterized membrane protein YheB (UPF0754 family)